MALPWRSRLRGNVLRSVALLAGVALLVAALRLYDQARISYDYASIEARSFSCFEKRICPAPVVDIVPSLIVGALAVATVAVSLAALLRPTGGGPVNTHPVQPPPRTPAAVAGAYGIADFDKRGNR